jgi:hypothetical protein
MAQLSESEARAAISAIIEREEREGIISPEEISLRNRVWTQRNLKKHLEPIFAEVVDRLGLDKEKIGRALAQHQDEVTKYLKEQQADTDKKFAVLTKRYQEEMANRKAAIEQIIALAPAARLTYLDRPIFISAAPTGILIDDHIESYKSFAKVFSEVTEDWTYGYRSVSFWFVWPNESDDDVMVKGASAFLTVAGKCTAHTDWSVTWPNSAYLSLYGALGVYVGQTFSGGLIEYIEHCDLSGTVFGGDDSKDVFRTVVPSVSEILVQAHQAAIIFVRLFLGYRLNEGYVKAELDKVEPFVSCPLLWLNIETLPSLETFSETLTANEGGWEGYCLVQRIEPIRLSQSGTHVRLTLRASSASAAYIDRIFISQADPAGDSYDSAADLTELRGTRLTVPAGAAVTTPYVDYTLDPQKPLLIAFDFGGAPPSGIRYRDAVPTEEASAYWQHGHQAGNTDRGGTFEPEQRIYLIEKIEVR